MEFQLKYKLLISKYCSIEDNETLRKYKILKELFVIGKKMHGYRFNLHKMSDDLDVPYTTVKRIMSLNKANKNTWKLIKENKITAFRVAYILSTRDNTYQDELINLAIEKNLTTYDIKKLRLKDYKDIEKARLSIAVEKGFARRDTCYNSFISTLTRFDDLFMIDKEQLPEKKIPILAKKLNQLKDDIPKFLGKINE
jgi:hypothetical protein